VTTITEWHWNFEVLWTLKLQAGVDDSSAVVLATHKVNTELITLADSSPRPARRVCDALTANVSWLVAHGLADAEAVQFSIDRSKRTCHTPSNNDDVAAAHACFVELHNFCNHVAKYFLGELRALINTSGLDVASLFAEYMYIPVLPVSQGGVWGLCLVIV
jgi:hypothetical protein